MFIKNVEDSDTCFEVDKIYLEGDHYVVVGGWVSIRFKLSYRIGDTDTIYIHESLVKNWIATDAEDYSEIGSVAWKKLREVI